MLRQLHIASPWKSLIKRKKKTTTVDKEKAFYNLLQGSHKLSTR